MTDVIEDFPASESWQALGDAVPLALAYAMASAVLR